MLKDRIKKLRKSLNFTQKEFGEKIGVASNTVTNYETGLREPSNAVITSICREFNVNEEWLRNGEGEMFNQIPHETELGHYIGKILKPGTDNDFIKKIIITYMQLDENGKKIIRDFAERLGSNK